MRKRGLEKGVLSQSYREIEEILAERGIIVDHSTLNRWVIKYAPLLEQRASKKKKPDASSWRMDETYINVKGQWKGAVAKNEYEQIYPGF